MIQMQKTYIVLFLPILMLAWSCEAQSQLFRTDSRKAKKLMEDAISFYNLRYYEKAFDHTAMALNEDSNFVDAYMLRGEMHMELNNAENALANFKKAIQLYPNEYPTNYYNAGKASLTINQLDDAALYFNKFLEFDDNHPKSIERVKGMLSDIEFRKALMSNPVPFEPINLGAGVNTPYYEHSPTVTTDEQVIFYTRRAPSVSPNGMAHENEDFFMSKKDANGNWGKAKSLGNKINTRFNEGASCISSDGRYLFYTSCDKPGDFGSCDLFLARRKGETWVDPINLGSSVNTHEWESQPSFSSDGRTLYFASNRRGGKGGRDIWYTKIGDNGEWSRPRMVPINTEKDDQSPFIHPNGTRFYFSSNGLPGMGSSDLYYVDIDQDGQWGKPQNMGYPINTAGSEVSLIVSSDGKTAYYSSDMEGGFGKWDLYQFELPRMLRPVPVTYAQGKVYDSETKKPLGAHFEIIATETGKKMVEATADPETGEFMVVIPTAQQYALNASADGYLFFSESFNFSSDTGSLYFDVPLQPVKVGKKVVLKNVFFETAKYELKSTSKAELDKLVQFLKKNQSLEVEIGGHTDNVGSETYNQDLSENRAKSVYEYLIGKGISASRLSYKGYNFSEPIASNDSEQGRAKNRRTEFKITGQ